MAMVTQCPHCSTAFNVTPEQLFARDGRVRCGQCRRVFDGLVNLTSLEALQAGVPPPLAEASDAELRAKVEEIESERSTPLAGFAPLNWPMVPEVPVVPIPPMASGVAQEVAQPASVAEHADASGEMDAPPADALAATDTIPPAVPPETVVPPPASASEPATHEAGSADAPRHRSWPWAIAATLAALSLGAQAFYGFRNELAAHVPGVRPALAQMCAWARCTIRPLQKPSALAIQASDLLILDKGRPHLVQLIVTMQNQSSVEVAYPAIDLVLNDRFDHAVARRVFLPGEYLQKFDPQTSVIAASGTTTVRIDLDVSELSAGGFALLLIPAPQT